MPGPHCWYFLLLLHFPHRLCDHYTLILGLSSLLTYEDPLPWLLLSLSVLYTVFSFGCLWRLSGPSWLSSSVTVSWSDSVSLSVPFPPGISAWSSPLLLRLLQSAIRFGSGGLPDKLYTLPHPFHGRCPVYWFSCIIVRCGRHIFLFLSCGDCNHHQKNSCKEQDQKLIFS